MAYFFDILKTILFGIVEGITEWLPISLSLIHISEPTRH